MELPLDGSIVLPRLSPLVGTISLEETTTCGPFYTPGKISLPQALSGFRDDDGERMISNKPILLVERGLMLCHTGDSSFGMFYVAQYITAASGPLVFLPDGIFRVHFMPYMPARQQFLAIRSFQNALNGNIMADRSLGDFSQQKTVTRAKRDDDTMLDPIFVMLAIIVLSGIPPADFIPTNGQSNGHCPSIFLIDNSGPEGGRGTVPKLGLRLKRKRARNDQDPLNLTVAFGQKDKEMRIRDLLDLAESRGAFTGSHSTSPAGWLEEFMTLKVRHSRKY
ncbi:hypothetical protein DM02DRAFT_263744 [Periconia macrospinosa]|uniref:Uncharacterized protein n=1 Tax=Periconia macrospinosa TaxID=97972 RepID=A0A2V1D6B8_9PLEO|nr:hypothetical protein DM02DRAFT_263744 [Periconia macrospinosa]